MVCCEFTAIDHGMHILTSNSMLVFIRAASHHMDDFSTCIWVIFLVAALASSQLMKWWLWSCCVTISDVFDEATANRPDLDPLGPSRSCCISMICLCGIGEEKYKEKKWEVLRIIELASCPNGIISCQHVRYTQDEFCGI
jgi:hypothetical protein